jgi:dipeptidyl-peptidase III
MAKICTELTEARKCATTKEQKTALSQFIETFHTGNYEVFRSAHKTWVKDKAPRD